MQKAGVSFSKACSPFAGRISRVWRIRHNGQMRLLPWAQSRDPSSLHKSCQFYCLHLDLKKKNTESGNQCSKPAPLPCGSLEDTFRSPRGFSVWDWVDGVEHEGKCHPAKKQRLGGLGLWLSVRFRNAYWLNFDRGFGTFHINPPPPLSPWGRNYQGVRKTRNTGGEEEGIEK